ncbi:hypothetical protein [Photorhabdus cinerea]|uniref:hypothetical protein n=1 Tax=Photorhabdus cinerea TaxID=471575 RepID=UPI00140E2E22|nr:hypothetical protein [Photorhabdus cinerea]
MSINAFTRLLQLGARLNQPLPLHCLSGWFSSMLVEVDRAPAEALNQHHLYSAKTYENLRKRYTGQNAPQLTAVDYRFIWI